MNSSSLRSHEGGRQWRPKSTSNQRSKELCAPSKDLFTLATPFWVIKFPAQHGSKSKVGMKKKDPEKRRQDLL